MRRSLIIAVIALIALGVAGWRLWQITGPPPLPHEAAAIASDALLRLAAEPGAVSVDLEELFPGGAWLELVDAALVLPQSQSVPYDDLRALSGCEGPAPSTPALHKAAVWRDLVCGARASLPRGFFEAPPWMHPSGASYVALAMGRGGEFGSAEFRADHLGLLHAAELQGSPDPARQVLSALDAPALQALHRGQAAALAPEWVLLRQGSGGRRYLAWPAARLAALGAGLPIVAGRGAASCLTGVGELCWRPRDVSAARARWTALALGAALVMLAALLFLGWRWQVTRRQERAARRFILRSLTHELRTPVTALSLSLEPLRETYDALPPAAQDALLSVSSSVARLQRTLAASTRYLELRGRDPAERMRAVDIPSINGFVTDLLDGQEIELSLLPTDRALSSDPEWLALCVRNLVQNALRHGRPPVQVRLALDGSHLVVEVRDAGDSRAFDLRAMTRAFRRGDESKGLGLGLSLVSEAARSLGGTLSHRSAPTELRLRLPGVRP